MIAKANVKQSDGTYAFVAAEPIIVEVGIIPPPPDYNLVNDNFDDRISGIDFMIDLGKFDHASNGGNYGYVKVIDDSTADGSGNKAVSYTHLDVYKRQLKDC